MNFKIAEEPDWFASRLNSRNTAPYIPPCVDHVMQDDFLKPFLLDIGNYGLNYAHKKYYRELGSELGDPEKYKYTKTSNPKKVIIVGGGMSGLVSGYELAQAGHEVLILEMQQRVGGRVKTVSNGTFRKGLWGDVGAMREPGTGEEGWTGPCHFMTDFYTRKFDLPLEDFVQDDDQTYYAFNGKPQIKKADWMANPGKYCDDLWPGWRKNIKSGIEVSDITMYWEKTVKPIEAQLFKFLKADPLKAWSKWVQKWSKFTVGDLLQLSLEKMLLKLKESRTYESTDDVELASLSSLIPWSTSAVAGHIALFSMFLDVGCLEYLRPKLGKYLSSPMHTVQGGLETLPRSFLKRNCWGWNVEIELSKNVRFGVTVNEIHYTNNSVTVLCHSSETNKAIEYCGDMVVVALPLKITQKIHFVPALPKKYYKAMSDIYQWHATKILLQCRTRFWETEGIQGGSTLTNLPMIGSICYPGNPGFKIPNTEPGIIMTYCMSNAAASFHSKEVIAKVVKEISAIHPEIEQNVEVGVVQSWSNDPSAQAAFCAIVPEQSKEMFLYPYQSIYFCGDAVSNCNGWIQGAIISGLRAAYQVFVRNELKP